MSKEELAIKLVEISIKTRPVSWSNTLSVEEIYKRYLEALELVKEE